LARRAVGITGAGGILGSVLLDSLAGRARSVMPLFSRESVWREYCRNYASAGVQPLHARLPDCAAQAALMERCDVLFHLGGWSHPRQSDRIEDLRDYLLNNTVPAAHFVRLAQLRGHGPRLVFASSIQVYELTPELPGGRPLKETDLCLAPPLARWVDEIAAWMLTQANALHEAQAFGLALAERLSEHPPPEHLDKPYPLSKIVAEALLQHYPGALLLRLAGAHGPGYNPHSTATMRRFSPEEMLHSAMRGEAIEYPDARKHSMWIGNTWRALLRAGTVALPAGRSALALNVGARRNHAGLRYAQVVRAAAGSDSTLVPIPWRDRRLLDLSGTEKVLGLTLQDPPLEEDMIKLRAWVEGRLHVGPWSDRFVQGAPLPSTW
jgi:nucleoside-diphosphate-sugar epimerase